MSENNGWIKCSERLPEPNTRVLTCNEKKEIGVTVYQESRGFSYFDFYDGVTHWQPMPEPPLE